MFQNLILASFEKVFESELLRKNSDVEKILISCMVPQKDFPNACVMPELDWMNYS